MSSSMRWRSGLTDEQGAVRVGWDIGACSKMTVIHHAGSPARTRSTVHRRSAPALNLPEGPIPRSGFVHGRKAEGRLIGSEPTSTADPEQALGRSALRLLVQQGCTTFEACSQRLVVA